MPTQVALVQRLSSDPAILSASFEVIPGLCSDLPFIDYLSLLMLIAFIVPYILIV
ncbi:hypothetical protein JNM87_06765 [Candidatus Saccharibacteria bacterium]|nr:hypothetical protein [Candidatus Saccharibacteria bacterium]